MRGAACWLVAASVLLGLGCAKSPDWIQSTLVTVDVTGNWEGRALIERSGGPSGFVVRAHLELEQEGPKVTGMFSHPSAAYSGPLEGRVGGDVFHFRVIGSRSSVVMTGEVTVIGDEMEGVLTVPTLGGGGGVPQTGRISLRRVPSPPRPQP